MKKIMIAAAIVCAAALSQAATVSWNITNVKKGDTALSKGSTYMFFAESATDASTQINAIKALAQKGATAVTKGLSASKWSDVKKATAAGTFTIGTASAMGGYTLPTNEDLGLSGNTKYYAYAVIFDTETITDNSNYQIVSGTPATSGVTTKDSSGSQNLAILFGSQGGNTDWYAVGEPTPTPEPTSAMLLILGVAGLALKRKRA